MDTDKFATDVAMDQVLCTCSFQSGHGLAITPSNVLAGSGVFLPINKTFSQIDLVNQFYAHCGRTLCLTSNFRFLSSSTNAQVAIDCGSPLDILAGTGVIYIADTYFTGGTALVTQPYQVFLPYLNLWDDFLYVSARTGASVYTIPVPNGYYIVEFRLAEIEDKKAGERVFSIAVQVRRAGYEDMTCCLDLNSWLAILSMKRRLSGVATRD